MVFIEVGEKVLLTGTHEAAFANALPDPAG